GLEPMAVTAELSIRFLRPAQDGDLMARAVIKSSSARRLVGNVELWIDGTPERLVAVAQGSYATPSRSP
ncbi:MAG: PaaI family thioesterase, partial [Acidimicrobiia bacterium]